MSDVGPTLRQNTGRFTIGFLGGPMHYEHRTQSGLINAAAAAGVNLIIFAGEMLDCPRGFGAERCVVYELAGAENVDGLIVGSDYMGHQVGADRLRQFLSRYKGLPAVQNEPDIDSSPVVAPNFHGGMYDLVSHLIEVHHRHRIGFICGSEQSPSGLDRYRAYRDALRDHGIPFEESLVAPGTFFAPSGERAIHLFLGERGLRAGIDLDAIVAINDSTALDALAALRARGVRVPEDLAVVGYDDDEQSASADPPLTTVHLPLNEMGTQFIKSLLALLNGKTVPPASLVPCTLVLRRSCGCVNQTVLDAAVEEGGFPTENGERGLAEILADREAILRDVTGTGTSGAIGDFLDVLLHALASPPSDQSAQTFVKDLEAFFNQQLDTNRSVETWHGALSAVRRRLLCYPLDGALRRRVENIAQQARVVISGAGQQSQLRQKWQATYLDDALHEINQDLATVRDEKELAEVLARSLPHLGIPGCHLWLYEDPANPAAWSRLLLAVSNGERVDLDQQQSRFPSRQLILPHLHRRDTAFVVTVEPLFHRQEHFGYIVFEVGSTYHGLYEALREQISSSLKKIQLYRQLDEARRAEEAANRLKSRFLSTVGHELRTPLSMIVNLTEMLLGDQRDRNVVLPAAYRQELEVIYATGRHLDRLIRDVLDLGRSQLGQLELHVETLSLGELIDDVALAGEQMAKEKGLSWRAYIPDLTTLPKVKGDRTRLRQVMLNLFSNACKFTSQGDVTLTVAKGEKEVTVMVSDTGLGVPLAEQQTIFNEFHQSERTAARGYGGMGLGLAITRHLVELHGGKIGVLSSGVEGKGATFYFTLPVASEAETEVSKAPGDEDGKQTVLILTERSSTGERLKAHLDERGFKVLHMEVDDSRRWLSQVMDCPCGAIVLDCEPDAEWGWQLMAALKNNPSTQDVPVIYCNMMPGHERGAMLELGYLAKPLSLGALAGALEQHGISSQAPSTYPAPRGRSGQSSRQGAPEEQPRIILIIDDEEGERDLLARYVRERSLDVQVLEASGGQEALELMRKVCPSLVLLDLMMPDMDGFAVIDAMQANKALRGIPVVVMTAMSMTKDVVERLNRGVTSILGKGLFSAAETLAHIEAALGRNKRLGGEVKRIARMTLAYIHAHYAEPVTRGDIARHIGVNERYLTHCFHQEVGIAPVEYLTRYRIQKAKELLDETDESITDIAMGVGFSSSSYLSHVFLKEVGVTPREYRQRRV